MSLAQRRGMVDREHPSLSTARQCALLGVACSSLYYRPREASGENLALMMQARDRQDLDTPFYGSRRMKVWLAREGRRVSRKRVQRLQLHLPPIRASGPILLEQTVARQPTFSTPPTSEIDSEIVSTAERGG